jgi:glycosyltransferase involved in cell wall biosynthesis
MDSDNLVSVIIPCFNSGKYLAETIKSVLNQTYQNFEIIIVDDGSTDIFTRQYLSELTHPKIKVFFKENEGVSITRNIAISHSTGEYILPLDADDTISKDYLELAVTEFNRNRCLKLVTCDIETFGCKKGIIPSEEFTIEKILAKNMFVVSSLFKREDYDKTHGFNPNMKEGFEDWDFWLSLLADGGEIFRINKTCFYYRLHKDSRNNLLDNERLRKLRYQIYENHAALYQQYFFNPTDTFEYELVKNSMEYKIGKFLLKPFRFLQNFRFR